MIPRFQPAIGAAEFAALLQVWRTDAVADYERAFAAAMGQRHAVAFPYGRTGLRLLLETWGLEGKEIICPTYTCVVVPHAIVSMGARPVFIDSTADANMDLDATERRIGPNTGALIATSIFGHPVNLYRLDQIRKRHPQLLVIQDCAHSFACEWRGRSVQSSGQAAIFGCNISKIATSVFGGIVTTDDNGLAARLAAHRDRRLTPPGTLRSVLRGAYCAAAAAAFSRYGYGIVDRLRQTGLLSSLEDYYDPAVIDMPADHLTGLTALEGRVGAIQAGRIAEFIAARRRSAAHYREAFQGARALRFVPTVTGASYSHMAAIVADPAALAKATRAKGVELGRIIDYSCADMPSYRPYIGSERFPMATFLARHVVNLPLSGRYDPARIAKVVALLQGELKTAPDAPPFPEPAT